MSDFDYDKLKSFLKGDATDPVSEDPPAEMQELEPEASFTEEVDEDFVVDLETLEADAEVIIWDDSVDPMPDHATKITGTLIINTDEGSEFSTVAPGWNVIAKEEAPAMGAWAPEEDKGLYIPDSLATQVNLDEIPEVSLFPEYKINVVLDSEHPKLRMMEQQQDGSFNVYLAEGVTVNSVSNELIHNFVNKGKTEFAAHQVMKMSLNPAEQRSCKWFTPARHQVEEYGATLAESYDFDRAFKYGSCSNPAIIKATQQPAPVCPWAAQGDIFTKCESYDPEPVVVVRAFYNNESKNTMKLLQYRRNFGMLEYKVVDDEKTFDTILCDDVSTDWKAKVEQAWTDATASVDYWSDDIEDVTHKFQPETAPKDPYFAHVLQV